MNLDGEINIIDEDIDQFNKQNILGRNLDRNMRGF